MQRVAVTAAMFLSATALAFGRVGCPTVATRCPPAASPAPPVRVQGNASDSSELVEFAAAGRAATARYREQTAAIADGFHRVGVDFPAMGEHWVNLQRVMADSFAAARPAVLTYVRVAGRPRLAGVAYTALIDDGESVPDFAPALAYWHEHNGSVDDESFSLEAAPRREPGAPRLAVLHAWVWADNPAGLFVTENWGLAYFRLGLPVRGATTPAIASAVLLAESGPEFYLLGLRAGGVASVPALGTVEDLLRRRGDEMRSLLAPSRAHGELSAETSARLSQLWTDTWREVRRLVPADSVRIDALARAGMAEHSHR